MSSGARTPNRSETVERSYLYQDFMAAAVGVAVGAALMTVWHNYSISAVCIMGYRYEHFWSGMFLMVFSLPLILLKKFRVFGFMGYFLFFFGLSIFLDDAVWHYTNAGPNDGFSIFAGC